MAEKKAVHALTTGPQDQRGQNSVKDENVDLRVTLEEQSDRTVTKP